MSVAGERKYRVFQMHLFDQYVIGVVRSDWKDRHSRIRERFRKRCNDTRQGKIQWTFALQNSPPGLARHAGRQVGFKTNDRKLIRRSRNRNELADGARAPLRY